MKTKPPVNLLNVLSLFLPAGCFDYFDITDCTNLDTCYILCLEEKNLIPVESHHLPLVSNGFIRRYSSGTYSYVENPFTFISNVVAGKIRLLVLPTVLTGN